ncbi:TonB-dependent receptor [Sanyastnella coralliicola]|uniref:TonB-dependent receptor n=1 Tax=Sanyastnella coralliicola TaxID=3069118 RepID=UPI0027B8A3B3|nr:TonB-dependent receptor [Longitalea sp. SCSIO 12813]
MERFLKGLLFVLCMTIAGSAFSQGIIKGFVKDGSTGEPALFVTVVLEGTSFGVTTDVTGYYSLTKIPAGTYTILINSIEYEEIRKEIVIEDGKVYSRNFQLEPKVIQLGGAEISADSEEQKNQVRMSVETIRPNDIKRVPTFGGQADIVQVLTTLPGFVSTGDQGGQIYIRGGSPVQNKVMLDGMIVYNAFHSIGLFSVFDTDIISNADIYTGGFSGEFGGRVSSIMDITTRDGNKKHVSGKIGASPFGAKILVEGPLKKLGENGSGISYVFSAKRSYLEESSKLFYSYIDEDGLPFNFTDIYGKLSFGGANGSKFNIFGFSFNDDVRYQALSDLNWSNNGGGGNFVVVPPGSAVLIKGNFAYSEYNINLREEGLPDRSSTIGGFNFGLDFKYVLNDDDVRWGIQVVGVNTDYETFNSLGVQVEQQESTNELAGYVDIKKSAGKFLFQPSLRLQYYSSLSQLSPEPRLGIKYKVNEVFRLKAAAGIYTQNLIQANSDRDVVNLFYGFITAPTDIQDELVLPDGEVRDINDDPLQRARHLIAGFEYDITERWNLNVEGYIKDFNQVTNVNRNKLFPTNTADVPDVLRLDYIIETGIARGVDVVLKYEDKRRSVWFVYSLADVDRWDGFTWYDPVFDRRHNINFVASHAFGEDDSWNASLRWNLGTGLPFTQTQGYYQAPNITDGIGSDPVVLNSDELGIFYAELNGGRLSDYHRLDLSVSKSWKFGDRIGLDMNASVTNIYSRENVFYVNRVTGETVYQLPFLPSIGFDLTF